MRAPAAALAAFLLAIGIAACGGGGSSTSSTSTSTSTQGGSSPATGTAAVGGGSASSGSGSSGSGSADTGEAGAKGSHPSSSSGGSAVAGGSRGGAAAFLTPQGDNSIPTYGSEASSSEQAAATASLGAYLSARASGDWGGACAHMGAPVQKQLEALAGGPGAKAEGCAGAYAKLSSRVPASERANPLSGGLAAFRVKGDKAFALFYGPRNQKFMMPMASEGGAWKVSQIAPIPYPLGAPTGSP